MLGYLIHTLNNANRHLEDRNMTLNSDIRVSTVALCKCIVALGIVVDRRRQLRKLHGGLEGGAVGSRPELPGGQALGDVQLLRTHASKADAMRMFGRPAGLA